MLVERASGFHEHILSKKVEQLGADPWHRRFFFSDDRGHKNRLETVEANFWLQTNRVEAAGRIVGMALFKLPGTWCYGPQSLATLEHMFLHSLFTDEHGDRKSVV